ncbi:MAG TPA: hypothetical protein VLG14_00460 [Sphingomonas sp.]|nr:hypothetical protein [Sphingomonas sp.]
MEGILAAATLQAPATLLEKPPRLNDDLASANADPEFAAECAATYFRRDPRAPDHTDADRGELLKVCRALSCATLVHGRVAPFAGWNGKIQRCGATSASS